MLHPTGASLAIILALRAVLVMGIVSSCATLPTVNLARQLPLSKSTQSITFEGPQGPIAPANAEVASDRMAADDALLDSYLGMSSQLIGEPLIIGNQVDLLVDGPETYTAMFAALDGAQHTIDIQSYIFDEVEFNGTTLSAVLAAKVASGVTVRLLVDGVGSSASGPMLDAVRAAGILTCVFNPVDSSWFRPTRLNHRDHRKIVVVDGEDAFAGGINFSRVYRNGSSVFSRTSKRTVDNGWRDTHIRIRGPGARRLAELFADTWAKQDCSPPAQEVTTGGAVDPVAKAGETLIQVIPSSPDSESNLTYISVLGAVAFARKSIEVTMAYFVPDDQLEEELIAAVARGVSVRMILPGFSDFTGVFYAGRAHYARLLDGGVRIFEEQNAFLHAKTVVVDDIWSTVGSTNWDWRSFVLNDEVSVVVIDQAFATRMQKMFEDDLETSKEITPEQWQKRPWNERFLERFWSGFGRLL